MIKLTMYMTPEYRFIMRRRSDMASYSKPRLACHVNNYICTCISSHTYDLNIVRMYVHSNWQVCM